MSNLEKKILVETSARHVHLTEEHIEILFGKGRTLTVRNMLSQPGQFASCERVDLVGPKNTIKNVLVLGPARKATQVEISMTDARALGVNPPVRESGDIKGSTGIKIVGPAGEINIEEGVIIAKRHAHLTPEVAEAWGVSNGDIVQIKIDNDVRGLIFDNVVVRVRSDFAPSVHLDTDEANAAGCSGEVYGELITKK
ncbi:MAG TPA: phosphate propanoyltransferase [Bacillota bacterium]|nr:phosphate propanoyltransferase [Bacillota bacterium]HOK68832.1 phosphate propanoyltransferase [Bacillota bacterium]HPP84905.1 phosphate propanoyltransferase [Bacillota bacterium]